MLITLGDRYLLYMCATMEKEKLNRIMGVKTLIVLPTHVERGGWFSEREMRYCVVILGEA